MNLLQRLPVVDRRLLPEGRLAGPMPWVIAIMMFLTALAVAAGLALGAGARSLGSDLERRLTVQIVEANPDRREAQTAAALDALSRSPAVREARLVEPAEMRRLLEPWLGAGGVDGQLPLPAMIDVSLADVERGAARVGALLASVAQAARVDDHARSLAPLAGLIASLQWLSVGLVLLMAVASVAAVVLAARAALNTHRATIEVMHLLGATDVQIARLFQRRIALDAFFASLAGVVAAIIVVAVVGAQLAALGSELASGIALSASGWFALALLPVAGMLLAMIAARWTVVNALRRIL